MQVVAIDAAFETVAVVFLAAAMAYSYWMFRLTSTAEMVVLARPKNFFTAILVSFVTLLASQVLPLISEFVYPIPYVDGITRIMIVATAFSSVVGIYMALYYYRTQSHKVQASLKNRIPN